MSTNNVALRPRNSALIVSHSILASRDNLGSLSGSYDEIQNTLIFFCIDSMT